MGILSLQGKMLGQYKLETMLGKGGMAVVYKARQENLDRDVAVKVLPARLVEADPVYAERFKREAKIIARLEHPHIVPIYDYASEGDLTYVVMRLLEGGTLAQLMRQRFTENKPPIDLDLIADWVEKLGSALDYAHSKNIIHRDIKPNNIMFDQHQTPFLVDFGIVKMINIQDEKEDLTRDGVAPGTPRYMAPEQWRNHEIGPATDQYAFAIVVYLMLTGAVPFDAPTSHSLMYQHLETLPKPVHEERDDAPKALTEVIETALAKDPDDRYPTMKAFAKAFRDALRPTSSTQPIPVVSGSDRPTSNVFDLAAGATGSHGIYDRVTSSMEGNEHTELTASPPPPARSRFKTATGSLEMGALMMFLADQDEPNTVGYFLVEKKMEPIIAWYVHQLPAKDEDRKKTLYDTGTAIHLTMTTISEQEQNLAHPEIALWTVPVLRRGQILMDKEGKLAKLQHQAINWQPNPVYADEHINRIMPHLIAAMRELATDASFSLPPNRTDDYFQGILMGLIGAIAVQRAILVDSEKAIVKQVAAAMGDNAIWKQWLPIAMNEKTNPALNPKYARRLALLRLFKETLPTFTATVTAENRSNIEQNMWAVENVLAQHNIR